MKRNIVLIAVLVLSLSFISADEKQIMQKAGELVKAEKYEEALKIIEAGISEAGETNPLLSWKFFLLSELGEFDQALETALKKEKAAEKKSLLSRQSSIPRAGRAGQHPEKPLPSVRSASVLPEHPHFPSR